ncbi:hypothetical protein [Polyangium jinanense]|uniref:Uncharacterized protein n=1 Tax=Polyangium jinanense TaxID=2829994 RepID=A0A9X3X190_9BACT|nr:hypothetical protein [Polyangium jinanense]MDC3953349.1 hypothetical protein [Polyangium jinanense]MDC3979531.1 hypothetical protein [Polyangium jinanense]
MKKSIQLLMAAAIATSAPFLSIGDASADGGYGGYDYNPRFGQVDARFLDNGDLRFGFEQMNIRRQFARYSINADLQATYRCQDQRGNFAGEPIVLRDSWNDAKSFQASRQGRVYGEFLMPRDRFRGAGACRGSYQQPVLMRVTIVNVRLLDETHNLPYARERITCDARGAYGYDDTQYGPGKGDIQYGPGKGDIQYGPGKGDEYYGDEGQYGGADDQFDIGPGDTQYGGDVQYGPGKGDVQYGPGKGDVQYGPGKGDVQYGPGKGDVQYGPSKGDVQYGPSKGDIQYSGGDSQYAPSKGDVQYSGGKGDINKAY